MPESRVLRRIPAALVAAAVVAFGFRFFRLVYRDAVNVFFWDQWDFLNGFFDGKPTIARLFFWQHGPIREGVGLVADKLLYALTHWSTRAESFMIGGCVFAAMLLALLLKMRLFGGFSYSDISIPLIFLTLSQYETLVGTPNAAYSGFPLLLIMMYSLVLLQPGYLLKYVLLSLLNFLLIYTAFGIFMGAVTIGYFALECYRSARRASPAPLRWAIAALVLASAALGSFFINYTFMSAVDCFEIPHHHFGLYPWFVAVMLAAFLGVTYTLQISTLVGTVILLFMAGILIALLVDLVKHGDFKPLHLVVAVLLSYSVLWSADTAVGRLCLGLPQAAQQSRYMTLLIPAFLGMYFYLLLLPAGVFRKTLPALFAVVMAWGASRYYPDADRIAKGKRAWAACYIKREDIEYCDRATQFPIYPLPDRTDLKKKLDFLKEHHLNLFGDDNDFR